MEPHRKRGKQVLRERDLSKEQKARQHDREQGLADVFYRILHYTLIGAPILIGLWFAVLFVHFAMSGDWTDFEDQGITFIKVVVAYIVGLFARFTAPQK